MREVKDRIKTYANPDDEWTPFLMLDSEDTNKFVATEIPAKHFEDKDSVDHLFADFIPQTIDTFGAIMAAFIKPVWIGKVKSDQEAEDVNHFHQGILIVMATPNNMESWVAPIIRAPDKEPSVGGFTFYKMDFDVSGQWIRKAFDGILNGTPYNKLLEQGGDRDVEAPPDGGNADP